MFYSCKQDLTKKNGYKIIKKETKGRWKNFFDTESEAIQDFKKAESIADEKHNNFVDAIIKLRDKIGSFSFDYEYVVLDDSGLDIYPCVEFVVNGYEFKYKI